MSHCIWMILLLTAFPVDAPSQAASPAGDPDAKATQTDQATQRTALLTVPAPAPKPTRLRGKDAWISIAEQAARRHGVSSDLVHAVILTESAYNPKALSHKGATGLMQLMPPTARRFGVADSWDPAQNVDGGVRYLRFLISQFDDIELVLAAYNAGENAVARYGNQIPPYAETEHYVVKVQAYLARLNAGAAVKSLIGKGFGGGGGTRLSGWGLIFGFFPERAEARSVLQRQRAKLKAVLTRGRPAVVPRELENGKRFGALLVGLNEKDAGAACKHLRSLRTYCLALTPQELKDPLALWRS